MSRIFSHHEKAIPVLGPDATQEQIVSAFCEIQMAKLTKTASRKCT